jgi:hypothetical protein
MIYRYAGSERVVVPEQEAGADGKRLPSNDPMLPLPPMARGIEEGQHYVVSALDFRLDARGFGTIPWVALVEAVRHAPCRPPSRKNCKVNL